MQLGKRQGQTMTGHVAKPMRGLVACLAVGLVLGLPVVAPPAQAQGLSLRGAGTAASRTSQFERQTRLMDSRLSTQYQQSSRLRPDAGRVVVAAAPADGPIPAYKGRRSTYLPHAREAARRHGIPEDLFLRLVQQESGWNPNARSHKGARGLAQLMPATAARLGVNPDDPLQNLDGGARYLRMMYNTFGNWRLALAAYNAGPGAVQKYGGIPPYRETTAYVRIIAGS